MTSPDKANDDEKSLKSSEDEEGVKEATGKEDSGEVKPAKKKMRKMEGCTIYSCKEEEAEAAKKKVVLVKKKKKMKKRCALDSCKTRLGLTAYQCRCGRCLKFGFLFSHCMVAFLFHCTPIYDCDGVDDQDVLPPAHPCRGACVRL